MRGKHGNGNGHGKSLAIEAQRLLPTPRATDGTKGGPNQRGSSGDLMLPSAVQQFNLLPAQAAKHGATPDLTANGHGSNLWDIPTLLPTPQTRDYKDAKLQDTNHRPGHTDSVPRAIFHTTDDYGQYAPAIARWEQTIGEPAPPPTKQPITPLLIRVWPHVILVALK
jgi:DNA (cytosine-5)-methyltransferase 1